MYGIDQGYKESVPSSFNSHKHVLNLSSPAQPIEIKKLFFKSELTRRAAETLHSVHDTIQVHSTHETFQRIPLLTPKRERFSTIASPEIHNHKGKKYSLCNLLKLSRIPP